MAIRNDSINGQANPQRRDSPRSRFVKTQVGEKHLDDARYLSLLFFLILSAYFYFAGDASLCADEDGGYYDNLLTSPASRFPGPVGGVSTTAGFTPRRAKSQRDTKASHPLERKIVSCVFYSRVFLLDMFLRAI